MAGALELGCRSPFLAVAALCGVAAVNAHRNAPETLHKAREEAEAARAIGAAANGCPAGESAEATRDASKSASSEYAHTASERAGGEAHLTSSEVELDASTRATDAHADADARSTLSLFSSRDFLAVSGLNAALFFSGAGGRATLLPLLAAQEFGYTPAALGVMFSGMAATSMLGVLPGAAVGDKHGRSALIFPCVAASAAAVATTGSTTNHEVFVASAFAWAGAHSLMGPAPAAYAADVTPPSIRGTALSVYRTCGDVGLLVGPVALARARRSHVRGDGAGGERSGARGGGGRVSPDGETHREESRRVEVLEGEDDDALSDISRATRRLRPGYSRATRRVRPGYSRSVTGH